MLIDSVMLKKELRKQKIHKHDDVVERSFNLGIGAAIDLVEVFEKVFEKEV